jgi:Holliday junction DNA helicase RuvB
LRSRFGIIEKFEWYTVDELVLIIKQTADFFHIIIDDAAMNKIAQASRGTPRIAKKIMQKVRDYAIVKTNNIISLAMIDEVFSFFHILDNGLTYTDIVLLQVLHERAHPIGVESLAALINEEVEAIEDVYEPFLLRLGYIERTPRGRILRKEKREEIADIITKNKMKL